MLRSLALAWLVACASAQADEPAPALQLGGISEYRLPSGLQVLLMPLPGEPRVSVTVTYRVGSRNEGPGEAGMAHLLEHVTFHATNTHADLAAELQVLSVRFNGTTTLDRTNYLDNFEADDGVLAQVLALEAERMGQCRLAEADFDKEKPIVLNEMALRSASVPGKLRAALLGATFRQHPYGRPVIGYTADIEGLSLERLHQFYARHYRPDQAVLMVAGGFDMDKARAAITNSFSALPPAASTDVPLPPEPPQASPRLVTLHSAVTGLAVGWRVPGMADPQAAALAVLGQWLSSLPTAFNQDHAHPALSLPLDRLIVNREPFVLGQYLVLPQTRSNDAATHAALLQQAQDWAAGFENMKLDDASRERMRQLINRGVLDMRRVLRDPTSAPQLISDGVGAGDWRLPFKLLDGLEALTPDAVFDAAKIYLRPENRTLVLGVSDPQQAATEVIEQPLGGLAGLFSRPVQMPSAQDPAAQIGELKARAGAEAGDRFETDPQALDKATQRLQLPSGIKLALLERKSIDERVSALLLLRWGAPQQMAPEQGWRALGALIEAGGAKWSAEQVAQIKAKYQIGLRFTAQPQGLAVSIEARRDTLLAALQLVRDLLTQPTLPDASFRRVKAAALAQLAVRSTSPDWPPELERRHFMQAQRLGWGDAGYAYSTVELQGIWQRLDVEAVRDFYRRNVSANDAVFSAEGQLPDEMPAAIEHFFGHWKKPQAPAYEAPTAGYQPVPGVRFASSLRAAAGSAAQISMQQNFSVRARTPDAYALVLGAQILAGGGALGGSRLAERLREQDALSYALSENLQIPSLGDRAALRLSASAAPEQAARVEREMREEIERLLSGGVSSAELERARRSVLELRQQQLSSDAGLAQALQAQLEQGENFADQLALDAAGLARVTPEQLREVLVRLLQRQGWVVVVTGGG